MSKTRILLGSALVLSLAAFVSVLAKPRPFIPKPGEVAVSRGGAVRIEARPSHTAVHMNGSELFAELTVTLEGDAKADQRSGPVAGGGVGLAAERREKDEPISLALVLDTSGSMSGSKMEDARKAAHRLVELLTERDELALISFGTDVTTEERRHVSVENKARFHAAIDALQPAGSTNISGGLFAGWSALRGAAGARRLMLVSDGQPTVGMILESELAGLVGQVHDEAITVTALGVGAEIDGSLMLRLAERGGGMYGYLANAGALEEILGREVNAARSSVARNVELRLDTALLGVVEVPGRHPERGNDGQLVLHLADLRPGSPTRVLVQLRSLRASPGELAHLGATVTWRSPEGVAQRSDVAFDTVVVEDLRAVASSRDEAVLTRGVGSVGSSRLVEAAAAWEQGDVSRALDLLDKASAVFGMSPDALAGRTEVSDARARFGRSAGALEKKRFARDLEKKKLVDFGLENSGY